MFFMFYMSKRNGIMNLTKYQALLKTVELGGITRAAEAMGYTQ